MKKTVKKLVALFAVMGMVFSLVALPTGATQIGSVIGYTSSTDIVATINGFQLQSYNVNDYTYICVEDLAYYGFRVQYDDNTRTLSVTRGNTDFIDPQNENPGFWNISSNVGRKNILYTDIATYVNGEWVESSNINGYTIINFDALYRFGDVSYDDAKREISLHVEDITYNAVAIYADLLQVEFDKAPHQDWKIRVKAKGDMLMLIGTARQYASKEEQNQFVKNVIPGDMEDTLKTLYMINANNVGVSSIYVEYRNSDGSIITFYQVP